MSRGRKSLTVLFQISDRFRVVDDPLQWILQRAGDQGAWVSIHYCRSRTGLLRCVKEYAGVTDQATVEVIEALPMFHPDSVGGD